MAKLKEIKIDGVSFNVPHWADKSLEDFSKAAKDKDAAMIPETVGKAEVDNWLKTAHGLIVKANAGGEDLKAEVNTEELKAEAEAAKTKKPAAPDANKPK